MSQKSINSTKITALNAECFEEITQYLSLKDITSLSVACCLWLKDVPLVYEYIENVQNSDIVAFIKKCGVYVKDFFLYHTYHDDDAIYQLLKLIAEFCTNLETMDLAFSESNEHVEKCLATIVNLLKLKQLTLVVPILRPAAALHLSALKCLPQLEILKLKCTLEPTVDLSRCIKQCQQLRALLITVDTIHTFTKRIITAEMLAHCENLEELQISEYNRCSAAQYRHEKLHRRRCTFFEILEKLQKLKILHLGGTTCLYASDMRIIDQLPLLQHLTLENFVLCPDEQELFRDYCLYRDVAFSNLYEVQLANLQYLEHSCRNFIMFFVRFCPKLLFMRIREMSTTLAMYTSNTIVNLLERKIPEGSTQLYISVEEYASDEAFQAVYLRTDNDMFYKYITILNREDPNLNDSVNESN